MLNLERNARYKIFLSSKIDMHRLKGRMITRGGKTRKGRPSYKHKYTFKINGYFRDDKKACFANRGGIDAVIRPYKCGWYLNDKHKLSDDFNFINKENNIVWRQN